MSVVQVFLGRPRDLLPYIFPSISCICDVLRLIRCPRYCSFLVLNCLTISLPITLIFSFLSLHYYLSPCRTCMLLFAPLAVIFTLPLG